MQSSGSFAMKQELVHLTIIFCKQIFITSPLKASSTACIRPAMLHSGLKTSTLDIHHSTTERWQHGMLQARNAPGQMLQAKNASGQECCM